MNHKLQISKYIFFDIVAALLSWSSFFIFRKKYIEPLKFGHEVEITFTEQFYTALVAIPIFWISIYALSGTYKNIFKKSRLKELGQTILQTIIGVLIIFFFVILDDEVANYTNYYKSFSVLLGLHLFFTSIFRFLITSSTAKKIHSRKIGFNTLIIGSNENALELHNELQNQKKSSGFKILGFVNTNGKDAQLLENIIPHLGHFDSVSSIIEKHKIEEAIIAIESSEHDKLKKFINTLEGTGVSVNVIPNMYDILSGSVKMTSIFGAPLITVSREIMPVWQQSLKRIFDISISLFVVTVFSWLYILVGLIVKLTSKGPVIFKQERIGKHGKPFFIFKFRSMYLGAEKEQPQLSSDDDPRITPFGKFMRKTRLDELPQFFNVLRGEMSIVGPRPERQFFIDQIMKVAPHYVHLQKVTPGITSWGQVKYGYAENIEQMVARLKYDVLYIENMSLFVDFKILIYTVLIVLQGRGK